MKAAKAIVKTHQFCSSRQNCSDSLKIRWDLDPAAMFVTAEMVDERVTFVNSVCSALLDSRFGPGRREPLLYHYSREQKVDRPIIYDMTLAGPVPSYSILPDSEIERRYAYAAYLDALADYRRTAGDPVHHQETSPQFLGRGSP